MGRPAITTKDLHTDWSQTILDEMGKGASLVEVACLLKISRDTLYRLCKDDREFGDTIKRGQDLSEAWWTREGRLNLENKDFSATLWYMNMKNRFGWKDKSEIDHTTKGKELPTPILANVQPHNGHNQDQSTQEENTSDSRGDISQ
jgi:hypothetical protein